jgi:hypothetical protein
LAAAVPHDQAGAAVVDFPGQKEAATSAKSRPSTAFTGIQFHFSLALAFDAFERQD